MQNARISELEKVLAKSSSAPSPRSIKSSDLSSSEEMNTLKEENRVVRSNVFYTLNNSSSRDNDIQTTFPFPSLYCTAYGSNGRFASPGRRIRK